VFEAELKDLLTVLVRKAKVTPLCDKDIGFSADIFDGIEAGESLP
jgi:hypothetical protein